MPPEEVDRLRVARRHDEEAVLLHRADDARRGIRWSLRHVESEPGQLPRLLAESLDHCRVLDRCLDASGAQAGHSHFVHPRLQHQRLGQPQHRSLRCGIRGQVKYRVEQRGRRRDVHDVSLTPRDHVRVHRADGVDDAPQVDSQHLLPVFMVQVFDGGEYPDARHVHEDVYPACLRQGGLDDRVDGGRVRHVGGKKDDAGSKTFDDAGGLPQPGHVHVVEHQRAGAFPCERDCGRSPDAARGTGHQDRLVSEVAHVLRPSAPRTVVGVQASVFSTLLFSAAFMSSKGFNTDDSRRRPSSGTSNPWKNMLWATSVFPPAASSSVK